MRFYEYISQRKAEMLYSQLHREGEKKLSGEIKGGIPGIVEVKGGFNQVIREPSLTDKVAAIEEKILAAELAGPLEDDSKPWVLETMDFYWGPSSSTSDSSPGTVVWFGGVRNNRVLMLGGSAKHLIGRKGDNEQPTSDLPTLLNALAAPRAMTLEGVSDSLTVDRRELLYSFSNAVSFSTGHWGGVQERFTVLANRLKSASHVEFEDSAWHVTIATPLFVYRA